MRYVAGLNLDSRIQKCLRNVRRGDLLGGSPLGFLSGVESSTTSLTRNKVSFISVNTSSFCLILFKSLFKSSPEYRLLLGLHLLLALPNPMVESKSSIRNCTIIALRLVVNTDDVAMLLITLKFQFQCSNFRSFCMLERPYLIDEVEHITQLNSLRLVPGACRYTLIMKINLGLGKQLLGYQDI